MLKRIGRILTGAVAASVLLLTGIAWHGGGIAASIKTINT